MQRRAKGQITPEKAFAQVLRKVRTERGMSQETLGFESGYHRTYIGMLERGLMNPTLRTMLSLASALDMAPGELVQLVQESLGTAWKREKDEKKKP